jgi:hypothetical protein
VIGEHRVDGACVARADDLAKCIVGGQQPRTLQQAMRVLLEQTSEHERACVQLLGGRLARRGKADRIDQHEATGLHHEREQNQERQDAGLQAAEIHVRNPIAVRAVVAAILGATGRGGSDAAAPASPSTKLCIGERRPPAELGHFGRERAEAKPCVAAMRRGGAKAAAYLTNQSFATGSP